MWLFALVGTVSMILAYGGKTPVLVSPVAVQAMVEPTPTPRIVKPLVTPTDFLEAAAHIYGVNKYLMHCLVTNESGFRANAKNSSSTAYGWGQFINGTWIQWRKQMGEDTTLELRSNPQDAFLTMAWALDKGYRNHWEVNGRYCAGVPLRPQ